MKRLLLRIIDRLYPPPTLSDIGEGLLSTAEAAKDAWDAFELPAFCSKCFPDNWVDQIHDHVAEEGDDEDPAPRPASLPGGADEPAGTASPPAVSAGAPHPADIISRTLRDIGVAIPATAAEAAALELGHHYRLTPK